MRVQVRLFSIAKDLAGFEERLLELDQRANADSVLDYLEQRNPRFAQWRASLRLAVNFEYVHPGYELNDGDEVAVIPPVSGG